MLTDDEMTRELGAALREQAAGVTYTGRRRPPRARAATVVPAAAAGIALAAGVGVALHPSAAPAARTVAGVAHRATVTETISLDGFVLRYHREAGAPAPLRVELTVRSLPPGARLVPTPGAFPGARAWVGTDPASGDNALYIQSPARNGGRLFAVVSSGWTQQQLINLLRNGNASQ